MTFCRNTLILGSGGFVGQCLTEHLSRAHLVRAMGHRELDLLDTESVEDFFAHNSPDVVIHCAAVGGSRLTSYDAGRTDIVEQNLRMFFNLARCIKPHQRLICLGSGAEYDREHYLPKMSEGYFDTYVPADSYGFAKYAMAQYIALHENMLDLRIFGLYGAGEDYRFKFISNAIVKGLLGLPITIAQNVIFDYLQVNDFVRLVEKLLQVDWPYRHVNITPTESIDLVTIAEIANEVTGNKAGIHILNSGLNTEYTGKNSRLLEMAGSFEFTAYRQGMIELTEYYQTVWDSLDLDTVRADPFIEKCIVKK